MKKALLMLLANLLLSMASASAAQAQDWWSASACTAVPHFQADGTVNTKTHSGNTHGRGARLKDGFNGTAYLYVPVTAASGMSFKSLHLRAEDNTANGLVKAELIRQPRGDHDGPAVTLSSVTTEDVNDPVDGFQLRSINFDPLTLDLFLHSYYIRITLKRSAQSTSQDRITVYDVSLGQ